MKDELSPDPFKTNRISLCVTFLAFMKAISIPIFRWQSIIFCLCVLGALSERKQLSIWHFLKEILSIPGNSVRCLLSLLPHKFLHLSPAELDYDIWRNVKNSKSQGTRKNHAAVLGFPWPYLFNLPSFFTHLIYILYLRSFHRLFYNSSHAI